MTKLVIWLSEMEIIDYYSSCLIIIEDIIETFPIKDAESLFDILEANLKSKAQVSK